MKSFNCVKNTWLIVNRIISVRQEYLKQFNYVQSNEFWLIFKMFRTNYLFTVYLYKQYLALDNLQGLICYKIQLTMIQVQMV